MFSSAKRKKKSTCTVPVRKTAIRVTTPGTIADVPEISSSSQEDSSSGPPTFADVPENSSSSQEDSSSGPPTFADVPDSSHSEDEDTSSEPGTSCQDMPNKDPVSRSKKKPNRPKQYMTKHRKLIKKVSDKHTKQSKYSKAIKNWLAGQFKSLRACAKYYNLPFSTLHRLLDSTEDYKGSGRISKCLTKEEEQKVIDHVKWRASTGCGVSPSQLQSLIQEVLLAVKEANPDRITGYEDCGQLPSRYYVRRLVERNNISLRRTAEISKGIFTKHLETFRNIPFFTRPPGSYRSGPQALANRYL